GLVQLRFRLINPDLRVAWIQFADYLALTNEIAFVDGRCDYTAGDRRRDVRTLVSGERACHIATCRDPSSLSVRSRNGDPVGRFGGRGSSRLLGACGKHKDGRGQRGSMDLLH